MVFHNDVDDNHIDYNSKGLDKHYMQEERNFWFVTRREYIYQQMEKVVNGESKIIEIGAGTGNVSRYLKNAGYSNIAVGEMHLNGLRYAKTYGIDACYQFDLLRTPFEDEFDAVCMFDVLEHIGDEIKALDNMHKMLRKNGNIVLTVPAHEWLWSREDAIAGHKRRYMKKELVDMLQSAGFDVIISRYFFISIVPLLLLRRLLNRDDGTNVDPEEHDSDILINPLINSILLFVERIENKFNMLLPNYFGGSLFVIARKK